MDNIRVGESFPIGSTLNQEGVNFSLFSKHAQHVDLLLFNDVEAIAPAHVIPLDPKTNKTYHYWHVMIPGLKAGQLYGYRVSGPKDTSRGHRFDVDQVLIDPYAKAYKEKSY